MDGSACTTFNQYQEERGEGLCSCDTGSSCSPVHETHLPKASATGLGAHLQQLNCNTVQHLRYKFDPTYLQGSRDENKTKQQAALLVDCAACIADHLWLVQWKGEKTNAQVSKLLNLLSKLSINGLLIYLSVSRRKPPMLLVFLKLIVSKLSFQ